MWKLGRVNRLRPEQEIDALCVGMNAVSENRSSRDSAIAADDIPDIKHRYGQSHQVFAKRSYEGSHAQEN